ncbi:hypothetical protein OGM63_01140 [Plectonema radiosum NIES-515]|uniref:Peptidase domain-containing protein n=1 Tax=Plectonema radiosum NIES-515 TaxID=2986073 RepID=A0ABT3ASP6_9CYAN|nr:hypothetical protein [Plectonema radiosum]MCV3212143.1 hypothetical protein [Plectonema radiosum NIES-515]
MKYFRPRLQLRSGLILAMLSAITASPVMADTSNFGKLSLAPGFPPAQGTVEGYTGGSYSLSAISNRDRDRNACIGFADPKPDHVMVLEKDFSQLNIRVNSGGKDTTLLIQGPDDGSIRCGDDTGKRKDASIQSSDWKAGTYKIWVGTFNSGDKGNYTLTVQQP